MLLFLLFLLLFLFLFRLLLLYDIRRVNRASEACKRASAAWASSLPMAILRFVVAFIQPQKKVHTNTIFFIFVLSEDTGRLSGLRGSDNESEEE